MGSLPNSIKEAKETFNNLLKSPNTLANNMELDQARNRLDKLLFKEDIYWHQRSRNNWLALGDRNMAYFHKTASERKKRNGIYALKDDQGSLKTNQKDIENIVINYYEKLFTSSLPSSVDINKLSWTRISGMRLIIYSLRRSLKRR